MAVDPKIIKDLKRREDTTVAGAVVLTPKQRLLDATSVQEKMPENRVRWVNLRDPMKIQAREAEGYRILSSEEGGRRLGDEQVLMAIPREQYEAKVKKQEQLNQDRLLAHKHEMEKAVEGVARLLRDRHGLNVDLDRLIVRE